jgi:hypothetical protein
MPALPALSAKGIGSEITLPGNGTHKFQKLLFGQSSKRWRAIVLLILYLTIT